MVNKEHYMHYEFEERLLPIFNDAAVFQDDHDPGESYEEGTWVDWHEWRQALPRPVAVIARMAFGIRADKEWFYNVDEFRKLNIVHGSYGWGLPELKDQVPNNKGTQFEQGKLCGMLAVGVPVVAFDWESTRYYSMASVDEFKDWLEGFRSVNTKTKIIIYGRKEQLDRIQGDQSFLETFPVWVAAYGQNNGVIHPYMLEAPIWCPEGNLVALQYWEAPPRTIAGISNKIDMNVWLAGDMWQMYAFFGYNVLYQRYIEFMWRRQYAR